jgi:hypothetical protein
MLNEFFVVKATDFLGGAMRVDLHRVPREKKP